MATFNTYVETMQTGGLSRWCKAVLYRLVDLSEERGSPVVVESAGAIAKAVGCGRRQAVASLRKLEDHGYLVREVQEADDHNGNLPNRYTILEPDIKRRAQVDRAAEIAGFPREEMIGDLWRLWRSAWHPGMTVSAIAKLAGCPEEKALAFAEGIARSGILSERGLAW